MSDLKTVLHRYYSDIDSQSRRELAFELDKLLPDCREENSSIASSGHLDPPLLYISRLKPEGLPMKALETSWAPPGGYRVEAGINGPVLVISGMPWEGFGHIEAEKEAREDAYENCRQALGTNHRGFAALPMLQSIEKQARREVERFQKEVEFRLEIAAEHLEPIPLLATLSEVDIPKYGQWRMPEWPYMKKKEPIPNRLKLRLKEFGGEAVLCAWLQHDLWPALKKGNVSVLDDLPSYCSIVDLPEGYSIAVAKAVRRALKGIDQLYEPALKVLALEAVAEALAAGLVNTGQLSMKVRQRDAFANTRTRYDRCTNLIEAWDQHAHKVSSMGDLWGLMQENAGSVEKAVRDTLAAAGRKPELGDPQSYMTHLIEVVEEHRNAT